MFTDMCSVALLHILLFFSPQGYYFELLTLQARHPILSRYIFLRILKHTLYFLLSWYIDLPFLSFLFCATTVRCSTYLCKQSFILVLAIKCTSISHRYCVYMLILQAWQISLLLSWLLLTMSLRHSGVSLSWYRAVPSINLAKTTSPSHTRL